MNLEYINGDMIEYIRSHNNISVAHNCNCFHTMGAGIAKELNEYTQGKLLKEDKTTVYGDINKLGLYSMISFENNKFFNLYGMFVYRTLIKNPKHGNVYVHWNSLTDALISAIMDDDNEYFVIPILGCNNAGGDYNTFVDMIDTVIGRCCSSKTLVIINQ